MAKKAFAAIALAILATVAVPAAAFAAEGDYVPASSVSAPATVEPGEAVPVSFAAGSFVGDVTYTVTGEGPITLAIVKAAVVTESLTKPVASDGSSSITVEVPADAAGSYQVVARDSAGTVGTATFAVIAPDSGTAAGSGSGSSDGDLASTGYNAPMLAIWAAGGALLLGIALVVVLGIVRRQRATA
ncbi:MAG: Sortase sorted surface protein [Cryobacterium sp.]|jgi:hypothetical protein|nr:Sortase sorted surface protein [Cryobacterium sp.]